MTTVEEVTISNEEDLETTKLVEEMSNILGDGLTGLQTGLENLSETQDINEAYKELHAMKMQLLTDFEKVIDTLRQAASKDYESIQGKLLFNEALTEEEQTRLNKANLVLNNIKELEENNNIIDYVDSTDKKEIENPFKAKILEAKFIHKLRTHRIKRSNIEGTFDLINNIKIKELREKCLYFYNCLLNTYIDKDLSEYKFYIVFVMGMLRLAIKTTCSFETMEIIYAAVKNLPLEEPTM